MANETPKRIHLAGEACRFEEGTAGEAIIPGQLVELSAANTIVTHVNAGGIAERAFALEDALQGKTIDDAYASGDKVFYVLAQPGDVVFARLHAGEVAVIGSKLASAGNGDLLVIGSSEIVQPVAIALEAKDSSDSESAVDRIRVRIL